MKACHNCMHWPVCSMREDDNACGYYKPQEKVRVKPMSNADRIRAMSDEELAEWLVKKTVYQESAFSHPSYLNFMTGSDDTKESAIKGTVKWLKQPAEEVDDEP